MKVWHGLFLRGRAHGDWRAGLKKFLRQIYVGCLEHLLSFAEGSRYAAILCFPYACQRDMKNRDVALPLYGLFWGV